VSLVAVRRTPLLEIPWTNVVTEGVDRDLVRWSTSDLTLFFELNIGLDLFDNGFRFLANFQIVEISSGRIANHYWDGTLDALPHAPGLWLSWSFTYALDAGIYNSRYGSAWGSFGDGCYLFRPYFMVWVSQPSSTQFLSPAGLSEYAVADDHFLMLEAAVV
jgi:hypothetical protein